MTLASSVFASLSSSMVDVTDATLASHVAASESRRPSGTAKAALMTGAGSAAGAVFFAGHAADGIIVSRDTITARGNLKIFGHVIQFTHGRLADHDGRSGIAGRKP